MLHSLSNWFSIRGLKGWLKANPVIVFSARASCSSGDARTAYRFLFATRTSLYADAEREAQEALDASCQQLSPSQSGSLETRWHKGRVVNAITVNDETEAVVQLVTELKNSGQRSLAHFEQTRAADPVSHVA